MSAPSPARAAAARVLERVLTDGAFADLALEAELGRRKLSARDAALATELVYGTLRWQRYLDWILAPHSRRPLDALDPAPLVLLRLTAYQIACLERVPAFAAVNDAVSLARPPGAKPGVAEFVNAVLRSLARRGLREREPKPPADPVDALATRCSFPTWLAARWVARYGVGEAEALMRALNKRPPLTLRANTLRTTREALAGRLEKEEGLAARPTVHAPEGLVAGHGGRPGDWRAFADGACAVQDEASMLVARLLEPQPGETVADVCAAPGTKTTHLAQLMDNRGRVLAFDPQPARLALVGEAAARLGVTIVQTLGGTVETLAPEFGAACDAVLVDAPCSNLGVLRRNPEVKWRRRPEDLLASAARQGAILAAAATMVRPGGRLVYATCSLEPEENDDVARAFLAARPDFRLDPAAAFPLPLDPDGVLRCWPDRHDTDGFTAVRFRRSVGAERSDKMGA
ncbi:MAG: 16S rRNA (cytosine(967)-C(5))-methyltransferase [Candidatus Rokubacteria bacterium 13_1_40CM_69_27]|nr:MAG: 16S rRNA (cytosine(967)-C(5))-methyltransferase [Candidatus Rokubacteria bacterium 13_1_40CM_69_27]OLE39531.1 MAG: 16S rRNA (cytosine(967)-C(5))-methyltransferase [Candidatus Rokubacteria bacterium 13_1_20CM_2_70_7]